MELVFFENCRVSIYNKIEEMTSYRNSGFEIMVTNENYGPRNHFVIDRTIHSDISLPLPPKHFKYVRKELYRFFFYTLIVDQNYPPPPASLLRLSKMPIKKLKSIALRNDLGGWAGLSKIDLVKFLERHRYIFSDDFYKQRSLPNQLKAWVGLFADGNFAEHYTEVMLNTLTKMDYYKPTNQTEYYCWWKGLRISDDYMRILFLSEPNSFVMFEREMNVRFREMILNAGGSVRERFMQSDDAFNFWIQEWGRGGERKYVRLEEYGVRGKQTCFFLS